MVVCILAHHGWPFAVAPGDVILFVVFLLLALPNELLAPRALVWVVFPALVLTSANPVWFEGPHLTDNIFATHHTAQAVLHYSGAPW